MGLVPIVIVGSSGHAKVVFDAVQQQGKYEVVGIIDSFQPSGATAMGLPIIGTEDDLPYLVDEYKLEGCHVAIGDNRVRQLMAHQMLLLAPSLALVTVVHPSAVVARDASIGAGTFVAAGSVIGVSSRIGSNCIVNTRSSIDHDCVLGDNSSVAPGATLGGNVAIGRGSAVGIGATIIHGMKVGDNCVVGAGAVVVRDIEPDKVAYGVPARIVRSREAGERYL